MALGALPEKTVARTRRRYRRLQRGSPVLKASRYQKPDGRAADTGALGMSGR